MRDVKNGNLRTILVNLQKMCDYQSEKLRIYEKHLTELTGKARLELTDSDKRRLAQKGKALNDYLLAAVEPTWAPGTLRGWYHGEPEKFPETAQEVLDDGSIRMTMQLESKKIDGHRRVVIPAPGADRMKQQSLLRAIRNGQRWMEMLINGEAKNITDLAAKLGLKPPYVTRVLGLNNLAPDIVEAIVNGAEPDGLSISQIMKNIPEDWNEQRRLFGFPER